ncbi:TonB-dependent receptor plug domain-containing protein [Massilia violaceinigra]|uniref:TonB-dependent receptor plug domain-containing protein n=1 Tax=Massilia violaceinigra TaxID=2045208 RepID=UPI00142D8FF5|nr:TonB-dependent receptor [Massilia violaceinigra]
MKKHFVLKQSVIAVALTLGTSHVALAQEAAAAPAATVYITGSNLKRTEKEGTQPIQVITSKDIRDSGAATVTELMRKVPSMGSDINLDTNDGGFSRGVSTASLRGLSSTSTLILLNGRRMTPAAYADPNNGNSTLYDLNAIPLSALERVEILKDGASAVYGSDAIGGVINFITKTNYQGTEVSARASANDDGNFARKGANFFFGKGDVESDGYNVFITADVSQRDRVLRKDVKDIEFETYQLLNGRFATPYGSTTSGSPSFYRESGPGSRNFAVNRSNMGQRMITRTNCEPSQQLVGSTAMGLPATSVFIGRTFCNFDASRFSEGIGDGKDASVMTRGVFKLGQNTKAFAEAGYARTKRSYTSNPSTIGTSTITNFTSAAVGDPFQAILGIGHPDNPFPDARSSVTYRFENLRGGTETINDNTRVVAGLQGNVGNWDWESAVLYNKATQEDTYFGMLYLPTLRKLNAGTSLAALSADPTLARDVTSNNMASILQWDAKVSTQFGQLGGGAMGLAVGAEVRREKIKMTPDAALARGDIYGLANTIIDGERDVKSGFVELRTPFLKNFEMDFAGRVDKYPGIKTNFVPKVGAKWTVSDGIALRGTYGRGFRAPALVQVTPGGAQFFLRDLYDPRRCEADRETPREGATEVDCAKSAAGTGGANPDLVPEKSKSISFGVLFSPTSTFDIGLDFYKIRKEGEVALGSEEDALRDEDRTPGNVVRDPNPANWVRDANGNVVQNSGPLLMVKLPWKNQGSIEVRGVDIDMAYRKNLGEWGSLNSKLTSSYSDYYSLAANAGDPERNLAGTNIGYADYSLPTSYQPRWKSTLSSSWTLGTHAFNASIDYTGRVSLLRRYNREVTYDQPFCQYGARKDSDAEKDRDTSVPLYEAYFPECSINSWTRLGVGYTYTGIKNLTLNLNIQNVLDTKAPYDPAFGTNSSVQPLAGYNEGLHNPYGRYFQLTARYAF